MSAFPKSVTAVVPAKINLALCVGGVRRDHFHELATVYQAVSLFDEVEVTRRSAGSGIRLSVEGADVDRVPTDEGNLAWRAAQLVAAEVDVEPDVDIRITKRIHVAGGLAGGSADAAGALLHDVPLANEGEQNGNGNGAPAAPTVGDVDGDGQLEVLVQTFEHAMDVYTVPGSAENCLLWSTARGGPLRMGQPNGI